jgi:hypothetical protein
MAHLQTSLGGTPHLRGSPTLHPHLHLQGISTPTATLTSVPTRYIHTYSNEIHLQQQGTTTPARYSYPYGVQLHLWGTATPARYSHFCEVRYRYCLTCNVGTVTSTTKFCTCEAHLHRALLSLRCTPALARRTCACEARLQRRGTVHLHSTSAHARTSARLSFTCTVRYTVCSRYACTGEVHLHPSRYTCICVVHLRGTRATAWYTAPGWYLYLRGTPAPAWHTCSCEVQLRLLDTPAPSRYTCVH